MATNTWNNTINNRTWATASNWSAGRIPDATDDVIINGDIASTTTVVAAVTMNAKSISIGDTSPVNAQWSLSNTSQTQITNRTWVFPDAGGTINVPNVGTDPFGNSRSTVWINIGGGSAGGLIKTGAGTLSVLSGNTFSFSGSFNIDAGVVAISSGTVTMGSGSTILADNTYLGGFGNVARTYTNAVNVAVGASAYLFDNRDTSTASTTFNNDIYIPATSTLTGRNVSAGTIIVSGVITGSGTLNHVINAATGTMRLDAANTFTGTVRNTSGTLALNNTNAVQDAILDTDNLSGTVTFLNNSYIGGLIGSTAFTLPGGATTNIGGVNTPVTTTYNGALGGTTQLNKQQTGVQTLGGTATRTTAVTVIAGGAIQLTNGNGLYAAGATGTTTVSDGGLWLSGGITTPATAPLTLNGNGTGTSSNLRSVSGSNIYAGTILVSSTVLGRVVSTYADLNSTLTLSNTVTLSSTFNFSGLGTHVVTGTLASTGAVQKSDAGILKLQIASSKTAGAWTLNNGETWLSDANALGASGSSIAVSTVASGAKLYVTGGVTIPSNKTISALAGTLGATSTGGGTWSGAITLSASSATIANSTGSTFTVSATVDPTASNYTLTYSGTGVIAQTGAITGSRASVVTVNMTGGTVTFSGANTHTGGTNIGGTSTVRAGNTQAFGTAGTVALSAGTTLQTLTTGGQNGKLTVAALNNSAGGTIKIGG